MYFVGVEYFPRDRAGLERYDPVGYALIEKLWGIRGDPLPGAAKETDSLTVGPLPLSDVTVTTARRQ